jgi:hypothetical protein
MKKSFLFASFLSLLFAPPFLSSQNAVGPKLTRETIRQTVEAAAKLIAENYVLPEKGREMAVALRERLGAGRYDAAADPGTLAGLVTQDLLAVSNDLHLALTTETGGFAAPRPPSAGATPPSGPIRPSLQPNGFGAYYHHGFLRLDRLAGNIGYLELALFNGPEAAGAKRALEAAMNFLSGMDAVIIDLRYNGGGRGDMADLISSHFFKPEPVHLLTNVARRDGGDMKMESWTLRDIPGPRMPDKDLYVLISNATGSAAEHFVFGLKGQGRAVLVGERTAGAGFNVAFIPIDANFVLKVSIGRTFDPRTNQDWEKTGVAPDVEVLEEKALETAHLLALRGLAGKIKDENHRKEIVWLEDLVTKKANPRPFDPADGPTYAGTYGPLRIVFESGRLFLQRAGSKVKVRLIPLSGTVFSVPEDDTRLLEFASKSGLIELTVRYQDGRSLRYPKETVVR